MSPLSSTDHATPKSSFATHLFKEGHFTDFVIECEGYSFDVHKYALFLKSGYFRKLLSSQMKEALESRVLFTDITPGLVVRLVLFCYNDSDFPETLNVNSIPSKCQEVVNDDEYESTTTDSFLKAKLAMEMYSLAERFDMPELRSVAMPAFENALNTIDESGATPQAMLGIEKCQALLRFVFERTSTADEFIRGVVAGVFKAHFKRGNHRREKYKHLQSLIDQIPDLRDRFVTDYMESMVDTELSQNRYVVVSSKFGNLTIIIKDDTTAQDVIEKYKAKNGSRYVENVEFYLKYQGQKLDSAWLIDSLGLPPMSTLNLQEPARTAT